MKKTLSEQFARLQENKQVLDWWQQQLNSVRDGYNGATHVMNRMFNELRAQHERLKELEAAVETLTAELQAVSAANGKAQTDIVGINERVENMAEWAKTQGKR